MKYSFFSCLIFFLSACCYCESNIVNWAGNQRFSVKEVLYPETLQEIQAIINKALLENATVRAIGTLHSWSDVVRTDGYLINTDHLNKVLAIDQDKKQVRVQAGIKLSELISILKEHGLALPNQPAITLQSIAGVMSTATHGTGKTGTMADFIQEVELIAADGKVYRLSKESHPELFSAVRVNIGCLGIVYAVILQCVPLFWVRHAAYKTDWQTVSANYKKLRDDHDYCWFFIDTDTDAVAVDVIDKTSEHGGFSFWVRIKRFFYSIFVFILKLLSLIFPQLYNYVMNLWLCCQWEYEQVEYGYQALSGPPSPYYLEEEIAIPFDTLIPALESLKKLIKQYNAQGIAIGGILCRFVNSEFDSLLSPAAGRDVVFVSVTSPVQDKYMPFYKDMYKTLIAFDGRPHWGKLNYMTYDDGMYLYGNNWLKFIEARKQLDPEGMFSNTFIKALFGW